MKRLNFRNLSAFTILLLSVYTLSGVIFRLTSPGPCPFYYHTGWTIYAGIITVYLCISFTMAFFPSSGFHYHEVYSGGNRNGKSISLTFDDGPDPVLSPMILEVLKKYKIRAGFFLIGKRISGNEALVRQMSDYGHVIGNHSYSHTNLWDFRSSAKMAADMNKTSEAVKSVTGKKIHFFRPPFGVINPMVSGAVRKTGMKIVTWRFRSFDTTASSAEGLIEKTVKKVRPGDILLFHDSCRLTAGILEKLIVSLHERGLDFVPPDELLNLPAYE